MSTKSLLALSGLLCTEVDFTPNSLLVGFFVLLFSM